MGGEEPGDLLINHLFLRSPPRPRMLALLDHLQVRPQEQTGALTAEQLAHGRDLIDEHLVFISEGLLLLVLDLDHDQTEHLFQRLSHYLIVDQPLSALLLLLNQGHLYHVSRYSQVFGADVGLDPASRLAEEGQVLEQVVVRLELFDGLVSEVVGGSMLDGCVEASKKGRDTERPDLQVLDTHTVGRLKVTFLDIFLIQIGGLFLPSSSCPSCDKVVKLRVI